MNKWLKNYAYPTMLSWWILFLPGMIVLLVDIITAHWFRGLPTEFIKCIKIRIDNLTVTSLALYGTCNKSQSNVPARGFFHPSQIE